jgi:hypothetical protein
MAADRGYNAFPRTMHAAPDEWWAHLMDVGGLVRMALAGAGHKEGSRRNDEAQM